jgi:hypothetical protein
MARVSVSSKTERLKPTESKEVLNSRGQQMNYVAPTEKPEKQGFSVGAT